jgi:hypothetical protein
MENPLWELWTVPQGPGLATWSVRSSSEIIRRNGRSPTLASYRYAAQSECDDFVFDPIQTIKLGPTESGNLDSTGDTTYYPETFFIACLQAASYPSKSRPRSESKRIYTRRA